MSDLEALERRHAKRANRKAGNIDSSGQRFIGSLNEGKRSRMRKSPGNTGGAVESEGEAVRHSKREVFQEPPEDGGGARNRKAGVASRHVRRCQLSCGRSYAVEA
jgi:hypothetical protein